MPPKRRSLKSKAKEEDEQELQLSPGQEEIEAEAEVAAAVDQLLASPEKELGEDSAPPQPLMAATLSVARNRLTSLLSKVNWEDPEGEPAKSTSPILGTPTDLLALECPDSPNASQLKSGEAGLSSPSKKKRRRDIVDLGGPHHTYVMKLFDRSVDLAQFNEKTALYPVCRAWMANKPRQQPKLQLSDSEDEMEFMDFPDDDLGKPVRKMPAPNPVLPGNSRVPRQLPVKPSTDFMLKMEDCDEHDFLKEHKAHWKKVKQDWVTSAFANEKRYERSVKIIEDIFKRAQELYS